MRSYARWSENSFGEELSGTPLPVGVNELMAWLRTLPSPILRTERGRLGEVLRLRVRAEEQMARVYAATAELAASGSWRGGPTRAELDGLAVEEKRHASHLRELCRELGLPVNEIRRTEVLLQSALRELLDMSGRKGASLERCLEALALAELADEAGWASLINDIREAELEAHLPALQTIRRAEGDHLILLQRWLQNAPRS